MFEKGIDVLWHYVVGKQHCHWPLWCCWLVLTPLVSLNALGTSSFTCNCIPCKRLGELALCYTLSIYNAFYYLKFISFVFSFVLMLLNYTIWANVTGPKNFSLSMDPILSWLENHGSEFSGTLLGRLALNANICSNVKSKHASVWVTVKDQSTQQLFIYQTLT